MTLRKSLGCLYEELAALLLVLSLAGCTRARAVKPLAPNGAPAYGALDGAAGAGIDGRPSGTTDGGANDADSVTGTGGVAGGSGDRSCVLDSSNVDNCILE